METSTILYITLALLAALGFAFFQYLYRKSNRSRRDYLFFALRALAVFLVLLILINPKFTSTSYEIEKPELILLTDNSQSLSYLGAGDELNRLAETIAENELIQEKFRFNRLYFGEKISLQDSLEFLAGQTDIYNALEETEDIFSAKASAVVLLTDGNQSLGRDFKYFKANSGNKVFPVVLGDTTTYSDLSIERINANRYAFLNNKFPVEVFLNYSGNISAVSEFRIRSGNSVVYRKELNFSKDVRSQVIRTELPANSLGVKTYQVEIEKLDEEKNTVNNQQNFAIEVIDERTSVLILSDIAHPDLGAFQKSIGSNQQRSVDIKYLNDNNFKLLDYQLVILYQINRKFNKVIAEILDKNYNYLIVTGSKTDWNYLNSLNLGYTKSVTSQPQEIFPVYNPTFSSFQFDDIGFDDFPPLVDKFGPMETDRNRFDLMLYQELQGVKTGEPLLGVSQSNIKTGFLFGENIWRWRAKSYRDTKSFQDFDDFIGKIVQNLASKTSRQRLIAEAESFHYANQNVVISAQYFDENFQFDAGANLSIKLENKDTKEVFNSDLSLKNNYYQFNAGDLPAGEYEYQVTAEGKQLSRGGSFEVIDYNSEQQFVSSNLSGMQYFALNNSSRLFYPDKVQELINSLLNDDKFKPVQKSHQKTLPLIDWYYLLFILTLVLAVEWFYRKYLGLI